MENVDWYNKRAWRTFNYTTLREHGEC
jgi:hypothetical protein